MNRVVLDASAVLAVMNHERGNETLTPALLSNSLCSTVNLAEVQTKLVSVGADPLDAWEDILSTIHEAVPFSDDHARIAGSLVAQTRNLGLSLGDRACLALGLALDAPVYTGDKSWKKLKLDVIIHMIR